MKHSLLLLSLIAAQAQAQIIYTDVIPDQICITNNDTCRVDLDNDGTADFLLRHIEGPGCGVCPGVNPQLAMHAYVLPQASNAVADTALYASCLPPLSVIDSTLTWSTATPQLLRGFSVHCITFGVQHHCIPWIYSGPWTGGSVDSSRYLGLQFRIAGATHYGWARVSIPSNVQSLTLKDYAYNSVPDEMILAGDTGSISLGLPGRNMSEAARFFPNPFCESTTLVLMPRVSEGSQLILTDLFGREVRRIAIVNAQTVIQRGDMALGFYFYRVADGEHVVATGKIMVDRTATR